MIMCNESDFFLWFNKHLRLKDLTSHHKTQRERLILYGDLETLLIRFEMLTKQDTLV